MVESVKGIAAPVSGINNPTLGKVLEAVVAASREVSRSVRAGPLLPEPASPGVRNVHGELVHPLDIVGTERFVEAFASSKVVAGLVCEELDEPKFFLLPQSCMLIVECVIWEILYACIISTLYTSNMHGISNIMQDNVAILSPLPPYDIVFATLAPF